MQAAEVFQWRRIVYRAGRSFEYLSKNSGGVWARCCIERIKVQADICTQGMTD